MSVLAAACSTSSTGSGQGAATVGPQPTSVPTAGAGGQPTPAPAITQAAAPAPTPAPTAPATPAATAQNAGRPTESGRATLRTVRDIPLQGNPSRWDYQSFDPQAHRLYIAHLGDGTVTVYDTRSGAVVGEIRDVPGVHGVIAVPELDKVYATATDKNQVAVIDPNTLSVIATTDGGDYPDGLAYAPDVGKVYVSDEHGGTDTVIDTKTNQPVATIQLGSDVGNTQYDPGSHRILVAVGAKNQLATIDPSQDRVVGMVDLPGCQGAHGLAIDADQRRAFVACEGNAKLVALDLQTMQVVFSGDVGKNPDVLALDPVQHRLYVAAESGPLTVFSEDGGTVRELVKADAGPNAHSVAVDPETHHIYLPLQNVDGHPVLREMTVEP
jgi:YVTN family beta-propeller protein